MITRTFDVVNGHPVADVSTLDGPAALERKRVVEKRLGELRALVDARRAGDRELAEREALKRENVALDARLREFRDAQKREGARRNFAGIGSPLHEALVERFPPPVVAELEAEALAKLEERERRAADRKAKAPKPA